MTDLVSKLRTLDTDHGTGRLYEMYDNILEHLRSRYEKHYGKSPFGLEEDKLQYRAFTIMKNIYGLKKHE